MACKSCKNKDSAIEEGLLSVFKKEGGVTPREDPKEGDVGFQLFNISVRVLLFAITLLTTPLIMLFVVYMLFKTIILNKGQVDLMPSLLTFAKSIGLGKKKVEEENPEDYEDLDSDNPDKYDIAERVDKIEL
jgi:hypothetical protein